MGQTLVTQPKFDLSPSNFDLTTEDLRILASKLQVEQKVALAETLAYSATCKLSRGEHVDTTALLEVWDSIPDSLKTRDRHIPEARIIILGVNPRNPQAFTTATHALPHTTKLLARYISLHAPDFHFACISLRLNADKGPHRDMNNSCEPSSIQVLTKSDSGGNMWIADPSGTVPMQVHGSEVQGRIEECHTKPLLFESKNRLHATEPWRGDRRLALVAWTPLSRSPTLLDLLTTEFNFPRQPPTKKTATELDRLRQSSLEGAFQKSASSGLRTTQPNWDHEVIFSVSSSASHLHANVTG